MKCTMTYGIHDCVLDAGHSGMHESSTPRSHTPGFKTCSQCLLEDHGIIRCEVHVTSCGATDWDAMYKDGVIDIAEWAEQKYRRELDETQARRKMANRTSNKGAS